MAEGIVARGLCAGYRPGEPVLSSVDLDFPPASFTAVIGPNGSGKTTLLRCLAGLLPCERGEVLVAGLDVARARRRERARRIGYLAQREPEDAPFTGLELVLMGRFAYQPFLPFDRAADIEAAERALAQVDAMELRHRLLSEMSGGERQRIHLARALAQEPSVLLLDEPAASLDFRHQVETYRLLRRLHQQGMTIVVVSHDLNLPGAFADHVLVLKDGRRSGFGPPAQILRAAILEPVYGTRILEAQPPDGGPPVLVPAP